MRIASYVKLYQCISVELLEVKPIKLVEPLESCQQESFNIEIRSVCEYEKCPILSLQESPEISKCCVFVQKQELVLSTTDGVIADGKGSSARSYSSAKFPMN